jgi:hypothetical protein
LNKFLKASATLAFLLGASPALAQTFLGLPPAAGYVPISTAANEAVWTSLNGLTLGSVTLTGTTTFLPTPGTLTLGLDLTQTLAGNFGASFNANLINIVSDDAGAGTGFLNGVTIEHNFGGTSTIGGRESFVVYSAITAPTNSSNANRNYVAGTFVETVNSGDGGTSLSPSGAFFASNFEATACGVNDGSSLCSASSPGAAYILELTGGEVNVAAHSGSNIYYKSLWTLVGRADDVEHGSAVDAMLSLSDQLTAVDWFHGVYITDSNGKFPINSGGDLFFAGAGSSPTILNGINLTDVIFTGCAFTSNAYCVNQSGQVVGTSYILGGNANGDLILGKTGGSPTPFISFINDSRSFATRIIQNTEYVLTIETAVAAIGTFIDATNGGTVANSLAFSGVATTEAPIISSIGTDTNIGIVLDPKGSGLVGIGNGASFVAASNCGSLASSTGCLKITDYNGNAVFLPVYGTL